MSPMLIAAMVTILTAAVLYTIAVFSERRAHTLTGTHLTLFWLGLVFDTTGTSLMSEIAGGWKPDPHGLVGVAAIALMLVHSVWASIAFLGHREHVLRIFHRFSVSVWLLWMVALVSGFAVVALRG